MGGWKPRYWSIQLFVDGAVVIFARKGDLLETQEIPHKHAFPTGLMEAIQVHHLVVAFEDVLLGFPQQILKLAPRLLPEEAPQGLEALLVPQWVGHFHSPVAAEG